MNYNYNQIKHMLEGSYKKLKSYYYYDKTLLYIKKKIAEFESDQNTFPQVFDLLATAIIQRNTAYFDNLIQQLDYLVFPKSFDSALDHPPAIIGAIDHHKNISKVNFFIDLPIELFILDCLWTVLVAKISQTNYSNSSYSYAGKFKKSIFISSEDDLYAGIDFDSNRCFEPYFENYSKWQKDAFSSLRKGMKSYDQIMFSLDLKSFYYSVRFEFSSLAQLLDNDSRLKEIAFITTIIEKIYRSYTALIAKYKMGIEISRESMTIFPIGLLSPIVLRELYLFKFDQNIKSCLNPTHYGRYVDDMIVVMKVTARPEDIGPEYVCNLLRQKKLIHNKSHRKDEEFIFIDFPSIAIQKSKINCFFFDKNATNVLIDVAERQIRSNSSEANLLPEFDIVKSNFKDVAYYFNSDGGSTKIRDIGILQSNNYAASKSITLIKQLIKNTYITPQDRSKITSFIDDILEFYSGSSSIEYMGSWSSIFELIVQLKVLSKDTRTHDPSASRFYRNITSYINDELSFDHLRTQEIYAKKRVTVLKRLKKCLKDRLKTSISLAMALDYTWKTLAEKSRKNIELAQKFRLSNMFNHQLVAFPLLNYLPFDRIKDISLLKIYNDSWNFKEPFALDNIRLKWSPRFIHLDELFLYSFMQSTQKLQKPQVLCRGIGDIDKIIQRYAELNSLERFLKTPEHMQNLVLSNDYHTGLVMVNIPDDNRSDNYIGLANTFVTEEDALQSLIDPSHKMTIHDKEQLFHMANMAANEKATFLTFPEFFIPIFWLKDISRFSQKNQISIISGLRYIRNGEQAYNFTTIIQPYHYNNYTQSIVLFREKNFYAPEEKLYLYKLGYHVKNPKIPCYYVVKTSSLVFSTILCYEFTDINSRAILKSKIDALFVPQLNKDTNYFSSIVEATSRDLHCVIIQANTSKYGDSRITGPYDTVHKNSLQIKGGINDTILVGKLQLPEIKKARNDYVYWRKEAEKYCFKCKKKYRGKHSISFVACQKCPHNSKKSIVKDVPPRFLE